MEPGRIRLLDDLTRLIGDKSFPNIDEPDWNSIEAALKREFPQTISSLRNHFLRANSNICWCTLLTSISRK